MAFLSPVGLCHSSSQILMGSKLPVDFVNMQILILLVCSGAHICISKKQVIDADAAGVGTRSK